MNESATTDIRTPLQLEQYVIALLELDAGSSRFTADFLENVAVTRSPERVADLLRELASFTREQESSLSEVVPATQERDHYDALLASLRSITMSIEAEADMTEAGDVDAISEEVLDDLGSLSDDLAQSAADNRLITQGS